MRKCDCCGAKMHLAHWDQDILINWYQKLKNEELLKYTKALLSSSKKLQCRECGYGYYELGNEVDDTYYMLISQSYPNYYPKHRDEWEFAENLISYITKKLQKIPTVVDIGCGAGSFFNRLPEEIFKIGIDFYDLRRHNDKEKWEFLAANLNQKFPLPEGDLYTSFHVLEHIRHPIDFMDNIFYSAKKGSYILISVPNSNNYRNFSSITDPLNQAPHHLSTFTWKSLDYLMKRYRKLGIEYEIYHIEHIQLHRVIARLWKQSRSLMDSNKIGKAILQYIKDKEFSKESLLIKAVIKNGSS